MHVVKYYVILCGSHAKCATHVTNCREKQEQKRRKEMLDSLKRGDKIITIGGMYGTLTKVGPVKVKVRLAEGVEIEFARTAISGFQDAGADAQPQPETLDA